MIVGIEESRHGPNDAMHNPSQPFEFLSKETFHICHGDTHNIKVILFSIHNDDGNPSSVNIKQYCGRYKRQCYSLIPANSNSLPHAHTQALKVNHSTSRMLLLNKNVIGQKAQVHVKFSNSDNHELPHHQRSLK
ncbi:hypothetical protein Tco_0116206 [Tanacetum coccineum]